MDFLTTKIMSIRFASFPSIPSTAAVTIVAVALRDTPVLSQAAAKFGNGLSGGLRQLAA